MYPDSEYSNRPSRSRGKERGIAVLILLVLWVVLKKTLRLILKYILLFFIYIYRGIKYFISWWTDGNTKQKRAELWVSIKKALSVLWKLTKIAATHTWTFIVWVAIQTFHGLIHLRTTLIKLGKAIKIGYKRFRATDFKGMAKEKNAQFRRTLTDLTTETDNETDEEELLKEMEANKKNSFTEKWTNKINKYIE